MGQTQLKIEGLSVNYPSGAGSVKAVDDISLLFESGVSYGIMGESGSGKTTLAMAVMGLLHKTACINGKIYFGDTDLRQLSEKQLNQYRWSRIAIVFQNSLDVLNPVLTISEQILECLRQHTSLPSDEARRKVGKLLEISGLDAACKNLYPHQLSGGMRQRVLIAMALSCDPEVLIVDEPTNALDAVSKNEIIELLSNLHREKKFTLIVISHELPTISKLASRLAVMYKGRIMEEGITADILGNPMHTYTRGLLNSSPGMNPYRDLWGIPGEMGKSAGAGCPFYTRCNQRLELCKENMPQLKLVAIERKVACNRGGIATILKASGTCKHFSHKNSIVTACDSCSMEIRAGEVVALIGESGSGKTTLANILCGIISGDAGEVCFKGDKINGSNATCIKNGIQIVFQDPFSSINENFSIESAIREPLDIVKQDSPEKRRELAIKALESVQLPSDGSFLERKCHTLSGGQRQRVALARALVMEPALLIADEISSMLDPSTQANILRLLKGLQNTRGFSMLYITHDLPVAQKIADRVYVMHKGRIIEKGNAQSVFGNPRQSYTKKLVTEGINAL